MEGGHGYSSVKIATDRRPLTAQAKLPSIHKSVHTLSPQAVNARPSKRGSASMQAPQLDKVAT